MADPFSTKELKNALKKVKTRKAPGPDGITGEMLKHLGASSRAALLKIFNYSWMKGVVPAVWKEAVIIPVPKKDKDKKNLLSYHLISLLSCVVKCCEGWWIGTSSITWRITLCYLQLKQDTRSSKAQRTNLPTLSRTSKMHFRAERRFWLCSLVF